MFSVFSVTMECLAVRMKSLHVTCLLLALLVHMFTSCCHGYIINNDLLSGTLYSADSDGVLSDLPEDESLMPENKRAQFSVNGELRSLAEMMQSPERQQAEYNRAKLLKLGKRNWRLPAFRFGSHMLSNVFGLSPFRTDPKITRRRSQQLSVSGPLTALADMLALNGRRRQLNESTQNKKMLLELGKRSEEIPFVDESDISNTGL